MKPNKLCVASVVGLVGLSSLGTDWVSIAVDGVATIPTNTAATVENKDVAFVSTLTEIKMGNYASTLQFLNSEPMTFAGNITGGGGGGSGKAWLDTRTCAKVTFTGKVQPGTSNTYLQLGDSEFQGTFGGTVNYPYYYVSAGKTAVFTADATFNRAYLTYLRGSGTYRFGCLMPTLSSSAQTYADESTRFVCDRADVFNTGSISYTVNSSALAEGFLDLNGYDQSIGFVVGGGIALKEDGKCSYVVVTSSVPAALTFNQPTIGDNAYNTAVHDGSFRVTGSVSFDHNCVSTNRWYNGVSDTTGDLIVSKSSFELLGHASWQGTNVLVKSGARLVCGSVVALRNEKMLVTLQDGATLSVPAGGGVQCGGIVFGTTGELTAPGIYSITDLVEKGFGGFVDGAGEVEIVMTGDFEWPEAGGQAILPKDYQLVCGNDEKAHLEACGSFLLSMGSALIVSNLTESVILAGPITGTGDVRVYDSSNVVFAADNSGRRGAFTVVNSYVTTSNRYGFGSAESPRLEFMSGEKGRLSFGGEGLTNDVDIWIASGSSQLTLDEGVNTIVQNGYLLFHSLDINHYYGNLTVNGRFGRTDGSSGQMTSARFFMTSQATLALNGAYHTGYTFNPPENVHIRLGGSDAANYYGIFRLIQGSTLTCDATNVLCAAAPIRPYGKTSLLDLNGYDQVTIQPNFETSPPTQDKCDTFFSVTSAVPAVLTVNGTADAVCAFSFTGAAGLTYAGGANILQLTHVVSTSTGALSVVSGTLEFKWGAGWTGNVALDGGTLRVAETSLETAFGRKSIFDWNDKGSGVLDIPAGQTLAVRNVRKADGTVLAAGTYAPGSLSCLPAGGGSLLVKSSLLQSGLLIQLN